MHQSSRTIGASTALAQNPAELAKPAAPENAASSSQADFDGQKLLVTSNVLRYQNPAGPSETGLLWDRPAWKRK